MVKDHKRTLSSSSNVGRHFFKVYLPEDSYQRLGFTNDCSLKLGEFLVFRYDGNSTFEVKIFDHSCCEREEEDIEEREPIRMHVSESNQNISELSKRSSGQSMSKFAIYISFLVSVFLHFTNCSPVDGLTTTKEIAVDISEIEANIPKRPVRGNSIPRVAPKKRTSDYFGVTRHKRSGRYEVKVWDTSAGCHKRKGRQVYLGSFETEEKAAEIYDLGALKFYSGRNTNKELNFPVSNYVKELEEMNSMSREEYVKFLRRTSDAFIKGLSTCRGVTRPGG
ncbi:hypothetical protein IFM89_011897 [Coptis chinensis]|uniref:AP2/ERF domain-containing protein n=1 Tax=Coptis chinensis TaxID=261450 RepID=A0A835LZI6_9MAGN|nr:hypothetical protein IFM89_011897 [Coptis chinensis]